MVGDDYPILIGDARTVETMIGELASLVIADPPFNINYPYDKYNDHLPKDKYHAFTEDWLWSARESMTGAGTLWVCGNLNVMVPTMHVCDLELGLCLRSEVIWYYRFGRYQESNFPVNHTALLYYVIDPKNCTFNADDPDFRVPSDRETVYNDKRATGIGRVPGDVWEIPRVAGTHRERFGWHPAQMPEAAIARMIRATSNPGDLVLDLFSGSGTTMAVAKKLGRRCVAVEMSDDYAAKARERVDSVSIGDPILGEQR